MNKILNFSELLTKLTPYSEDKDSLEQVKSEAAKDMAQADISNSRYLLCWPPCTKNWRQPAPPARPLDLHRRGIKGKQVMSSIGLLAEDKFWKFKLNFWRYGPGRQSRQQSLVKLGQLQQSITGWEGKDIVANSSEIVYEGKLKVSHFQAFKFKFETLIFVSRFERSGLHV